MLSNWGWNVSVNLLKKIVLIRTQCTCATLRWFLAVMTGHHQQSSEIYCVHFISLCKICCVSYCEYSSLIYISFLIPIRLKTRICDCLQTGPQRRRGLSRQVRGEWAEWKARRVPRMAPWRLSTLGTSARGTWLIVRRHQVDHVWGRSELGHLRLLGIWAILTQHTGEASTAYC